jgi:hypothetical protein
MNTPGNGATLDHVHELETGTTLQRLNAQHDLAKLPGAAALFLVTAMAFGTLAVMVSR